MTLFSGSAIWVARSKNEKTGDVPALWIGRSRDESKKSCEGCTIFDNCYAQKGRVAVAQAAVIRGAEANPKRYTLEEALLASSRRAKMARVTAIGDSARLPVQYMLKAFGTIRAFGLDVVGYTHFWRTAKHLKGNLMASCDSETDALEAIALGWRVALTVPYGFNPPRGRFSLPDGSKGIVCPAIRTDGGITCNDCRMCDGSKAGPVIAFPLHGPEQQGAIRALKRKKVEEMRTRMLNRLK